MAAATEARTATTAAQNPLCGRLQQKFSGRGAAAVANNPALGAFAGTAARPNVRIDPRVSKAANPFESTAEFVPAGRADVAKRQAAEARKAAAIRAAAAAQEERYKSAQREAAARRRISAFEKTTPFESGAYRAAYARAAQIRARAASAPAAAPRQVSRSKRRSRVLSKAWFAEMFGIGSDEVRVKNGPVSKGILISIVLFTVVVMMIVFSFSQIFEFKKEIDGLQDQRLELKSEIDQLSVQLDLKNDIRTIEQTATEDIGMVKSNQVQSKYISVSQGDRLELPQQTAADGASDYGVFATMMSAVTSNWDRLLEYIN